MLRATVVMKQSLKLDTFLWLHFTDSSIDNSVDFRAWQIQ